MRTAGAPSNDPEPQPRGPGPTPRRALPSGGRGATPDERPSGSFGKTANGRRCPMARPTPARFFVNSGIVASRTDIHNLLRPLVKQTVSYRYFRGRDLVASGTGWVERVVIDEPETSSYFTPVSICLNVDSFEHLDFETRPDQLIVYLLRAPRLRDPARPAHRLHARRRRREGRPRVRAAPRARCRRAGPGAARLRHQRLRPDGAARVARRRGGLTAPCRRVSARARPGRSGCRALPGPRSAS